MKNQKEIRLYSANWCTRCKSPEFNEAVKTACKQNKDWKFKEYDVDDEDELSEVTKVPTILLVVSDTVAEILEGEKEIVENLAMSLTSH